MRKTACRERDTLSSVGHHRRRRLTSGSALAAAALVAVIGCGADVAGRGSGGASGTGATGGNPAGGGAPGGTGGVGGTGRGTGLAGAGTGGAVATGGTAGSPPVIGGSGCRLFTSDDAWNADISGAAVDVNWTTRLQALVGNAQIHPDFGAGFGIPINIVPPDQPPVPVTFDGYPDESDPGPYPLPGVGTARVEGTADPASCSGDCHLLTVQESSCLLFEGYGCQHDTDGWHCSNGAKWDLKRRSYGQRPIGWTSADAAGLPIYAGLARYEEVRAGAITHAIRFTVTCTSASMVAPATHQAVPGGCAGNANAPPMGLRVRMKASFDISSYNATAQIFLRAFKRYGLILADNGSNFFFQSEQSASWDDNVLNDLKRVPASAFEAVTP
jgi:hypothetical protein